MGWRWERASEQEAWQQTAAPTVARHRNIHSCLQQWAAPRKSHGRFGLTGWAGVARLQGLPCAGLRGRREAAGDPLVSWRKTFVDWFCNTLKDECATFEVMCCHESGVGNNTQTVFKCFAAKFSKSPRMWICPEFGDLYPEVL